MKNAFRCLSSELLQTAMVLLFLSAPWPSGGMAAEDVHRDAPAPTYVAVRPGTHPGILFCEQELPALRRRARGSGPAAEAYRKIRSRAAAEFAADLSVKQAVGREGVELARQLSFMALVYQIERDEPLGRKAVQLFKKVATDLDPFEFFRVVDSDFFATEHWPLAFALAWDWLFPLLSPEERTLVLAGLERWNRALFEHTESWWWRDASYNCGAIPVGAQGLLLTAIQAESRSPDWQRWFSTCFRKIRRNYFPLTWRASGICNEGPGYAHYHQNPTLFAEAVRRTGGEDIVAETGAVNAMHYLRHQWLPQGGCAPIGDNTEYGRRVFQSIYLHGIRELRDQAGLWTFLTYTDFDRINPLWVFLFFPDDLEPVSPGALRLPTSHYFELDPHRAGYVFSRSRWDDAEAAWFAFVTRYGEANHTHYDMNSFLFSAFGDAFATHANLYPYHHEHHGVDFEHNLVILDQGGMPAADRRTSAGDDGSILGLLTGLGLGEFGDYVRGDARLCYADRSIRGSTPALRADRSVLFLKQGPNPYLLLADDIQKDTDPHDYFWQWYTEARTISGAGSLTSPYQIEGRQGRCAIAFLDPDSPQHEFRVVRGEGSRPLELGLLRVRRRAIRTRFVAVAAAWRKTTAAPRIRPGPKVGGLAHAVSVWVEGESFRDLAIWQPEEKPDAPGALLQAGPLRTDALMAVVRTDARGAVTGYILGEGTTLEYAGRTLVRAPRPLSASVGHGQAIVAGRRRARQALPPLPALGTLWLPAGVREVWADGRRLPVAVGRNRIVRVDEEFSRQRAGVP